jgi:membrane-associated phospholipid phosphatase
MLPSENAADVEPRQFLVPLVIGVASLGVMLAVAAIEGLPIRDPDARFVGSPLALISLVVLGFMVLDLIPRAFRAVRSDGRRPGLALREIFLERWWGRRGVIIICCLLGFYATYLAYRNLKSFMPFIVESDQDAALLDLDRSLFFGSDPATLMHDVLGTGAAAHILSAGYLAFLSFVPLSLGIVLIVSSQVRTAVWFVSSLCFVWVLGVASYYAVPSLGPIYASPRLFTDLPETGVSGLRDTLMEHRLEVIADPFATDAVQGIAAFASLHVAVVFTAALVAQFAGAPRILKIVLWAYLAITLLATIYFGWHYVSDDVAGIAIGLVAVYAAAYLVGEEGRLPLPGRQVGPVSRPG